MRKKRTLLICAACALLALVALLAYNPTSGEPSYGGQPLSFWVAPLGEDDIIPPAQYKETTNAIDHIGAAALPFLVKWIQYEPSPLRVTLSDLFDRAPFTSHRLSERIMETKAQRLADGTYFAFYVLGEKAMPAFDDLCRLMNNTNRPCTASAAITALSCFGTNAIPPLLAVGANTNHPFHIRAQSIASQILLRHSPATNTPAQ
jgi:hypothetical protein